MVSLLTGPVSTVITKSPYMLNYYLNNFKAVKEAMYHDGFFGREIVCYVQLIKDYSTDIHVRNANRNVLLFFVRLRFHVSEIFSCLRFILTLMKFHEHLSHTDQHERLDGIQGPIYIVLALDASLEGICDVRL
jgi:hypothetical protein